jgi:hypothetical protein
MATGDMVRERMNVVLSSSTQQYQAHHGQRALGPGVLLYVSEKTFSRWIPGATDLSCPHRWGRSHDPPHDAPDHHRVSPGHPCHRVHGHRGCESGRENGRDHVDRGHGHGGQNHGRGGRSRGRRRVRTDRLCEENSRRHGCDEGMGNDHGEEECDHGDDHGQRHVERHGQSQSQSARKQREECVPTRDRLKEIFQSFGGGICLPQSLANHRDRYACCASHDKHHQHRGDSRIQRRQN